MNAASQRSPHGLLKLRSRRGPAALVLGLVAALAAAFGGTSMSQAAPKSITVCVNSASTGASVANGQGVLHGAQAWAAYTNKKGGVLGQQIKIVAENDNSDPATAANQVRKCVTQDHASFILGPEVAATAAAAVPVANQLKTVMIETGSGWSDIGLSNSDQHGYAFPVVGDNFQAYALVMAEDVVAAQHLKRVAVLQTVGPETGKVGDYVRSIAKRLGFTVVGVQSAQPGSTNDAPQVTKLLGAHPQAIITGLNPGPDSLTGLRAIRSQNSTIPIGLCTAACTAPTFIQGIGVSAMQHMYLPGTAYQLVGTYRKSKDANAQAAVHDTRAYLQALAASKFTTPADTSNDYHGWDAAEELGQAIEKAGSTDTAKVQQALQHQSIVVAGQFGFVVQRTPQHYDRVTDIVAGVATVKPNGSLATYQHN